TATIAPAWASACREIRPSRRCLPRHSNSPTTWSASRLSQMQQRRQADTASGLACVGAHVASAVAPRGRARRFRYDAVGYRHDVLARPGIRHPVQPLIRQQILDARIERHDLGAQILAFLLLDIELDLLGRLLQRKLREVG